MNIREYKSSDKESVIKLLRLNTPLYFSPIEEADLSYYLDNEIERYYVVETNDTIVACGGINLADDNTTAKLSWDIVHPDFQQKGIGSQLTKFRIEQAKKMPGITSVSVRTSQLVYKFYEKFGLELKETVKDYWDKGLDLYRLTANTDQLN